MIIDFHTHTFPDKSSEKIVNHLAHIGCIPPHTDGSVIGLFSSMKEADIDYSVNLPVMTKPSQVEKVNSSLIQQQEYLLDMKIITFGGMHPNYTNYKEELLRLKQAGIPGIKLHPAYQNVDLDDIRMMRIIDEASSQGLITLVHAGIDIGIYGHNYSSVAQILKLLKEVAPEKLVLAHMGNWGCWNEVESDLAGAPVYFDTAFSYGPVTPLPDAPRAPYISYNLHPKDFVRLVRKHGTDKILFGTDSPWENQQDYVKRISHMDFTKEELEQILSENAKKLFTI